MADEVKKPEEKKPEAKKAPPETLTFKQTIGTALMTLVILVLAGYLFAELIGELFQAINTLLQRIAAGLAAMTAGLDVVDRIMSVFGQKIFGVIAKIGIVIALSLLAFLFTRAGIAKMNKHFEQK